MRRSPRHFASRLKWFTLGAVAALALPGCRNPVDSGNEVFPPGVEGRGGPVVDVNPRYSHDGRQIAFMRAYPDRKYQLCIADADITRTTPVTQPDPICPDRPYAPTFARYCSPETLAWSPDDRRIAFEQMVLFRMGKGETIPGTNISEYDTTTGLIRPLAAHSGKEEAGYLYYRYASWSPDQRYLAFVGETTNGQRALYVRPLSGLSTAANLPKFDNYGDADWPVWAPTRSGRNSTPRLLYRQGIRREYWIPPTETLRILAPGGRRTNGRGEIWRMTSAEYAATLPKSARGAAPVTVRSGHLTWSADGERFACTLTPDPNDYSRYEIWTFYRDGSGARRISPANGHGYIAPVWFGADRIGALSPDGDAFDAVVIRLKDRTVKRLGTIPSADCDWSPDRSTIVYSAPVLPGMPVDPVSSLRFLRTGIKLPTS